MWTRCCTSPSKQLDKRRRGSSTLSGIAVNASRLRWENTGWATAFSKQPPIRLIDSRKPCLASTRPKGVRGALAFVIRVHHSTRTRTATERLGLQPIQHQPRSLQAQDQADRHPRRVQPSCISSYAAWNPPGFAGRTNPPTFPARRGLLRLQISRAIRNGTRKSSGHALAACAGLNQA